MGHEGICNFLLVAMGNVVSALLMYALQAAWLCQRLIDQDYRQNHGSRPTPIMDGNSISKPIEIVSTPSEFVPSKVSHHYRAKSLKQGSKSRRVEAMSGDSSWRNQKSTVEIRRRKWSRKNRSGEEFPNRKLNSSHPYLEFGVESLVFPLDCPNGGLRLRKAFSDLNLTWTNWLAFDFEGNSTRGQNRNNCLMVANDDDRVDERPISIQDNDSVRLIYANGYVT